MPASTKQASDRAAVDAAIEAMPEPDQAMGRRLHEIITANAPDLLPRTWYGMPAYSDGGKVICYFRSKQKFGERYMTLGFNDSAKLDIGTFWPIVYALTELSDEHEATIASLIKKAVS